SCPRSIARTESVASEALYLSAWPSMSSAALTANDPRKHHHLPALRQRRARDHAHERLPVFLRLQGVRRGPEAENGRLLRLLLLRRLAVPTRPAARQRV